MWNFRRSAIGKPSLWVPRSQRYRGGSRSRLYSPPLSIFLPSAGSVAPEEIVLIRCPSPPPGTYGAAQWASGVNSEEPAASVAVDASAAEGWSVAQKGLFFVVILVAVYLYVRMRRGTAADREDLGYEKTMA